MNDFSKIHVGSQIRCYCRQDDAWCSYRWHVPWFYITQQSGTQVYNYMYHVFPLFWKLEVHERFSSHWEVDLTHMTGWKGKITTSAVSDAVILSRVVGNLSGPLAFLLSKSLRRLIILSLLNSAESIAGMSLQPLFGMKERSSLVNIWWKWLLKTSALLVLSDITLLLTFNGGMPIWSCFLDFV